MKSFVFLLALLCLFTSSSLHAQYITGYVYLDDDADGQLFGSEGGLSGVRVFLYKDNGDGVFTGADALVATQTTDIQGIYNFNLPAALATTVTYTISNDNDDAEEDDDGDMDRGSSDLEMMEEDNLQRAVGLRFRNIAVPQGADITEAFITFTADETDSEDTDLIFYGHDTNSSGGFANDDDDITDRTPTAATVPWNNVPAWNNEDEEHETPDLSLIIEEIVGRGGWSSGNNLSIIVTGTGKRVAYAHDGDEDKAARLTIRYDAGAITTGTYFVVLNSNDLNPGGTFTEPNATGVRTSTIAATSDSLVLQNIGYVGEAITCFLIPEDEDRLEIVNRVTGYHETAGQLNSPNNRVEAISLDVNNNILYAMDRDELGVINLQTGAFITRGGVVGNGDGSDGNVDFDDVDALSYDFNDDVLYGVQAESGRKLILIDPLTGELIEDAFGIGIDYVEITGAGLLNEISDLTFAPVSGELYGINTNSDESQIIQINKATGAATVITSITFDGDDLEDIEALAFTIYNTTTMYVTTGNAEDDGTENSFYSVNIATGVATKITNGANALTGDDYESCDCFFKAIPSLVTYNPLPIDLLTFSGKATETSNELRWETLSEVNFSHFEVYRSHTGKNFHQITSIESRRESTKSVNVYGYLDEKQNKTTYYKLKIIDRDGSFEWSRIISISSGLDTSLPLELNLFPNPATSKVNVSINNSNGLEKGQFLLYNLNGQLIDEGVLNLAMRSESIIDVSQFENGIYILQVNYQGKVMTKKLLVAH